jgi:hypothetical protein
VNKVKPSGTATHLDLHDFAEVWAHKLQVDFIEPTTQQNDDILRMNGFDQVRIANDLNVLGDTVLGNTVVTGLLNGEHADFTGNLEAGNVITPSVGPSEGLQTVYVEGANPYIAQKIGPNAVTMLVTEDIIGYDTVRYTSLAARNVMSHLELDNENNPMRPDFGITPLMVRAYPWTNGFDDDSNYIECYREDETDPVAAVRHDGAIWGNSVGFNKDMKAQIRKYTAPYGAGTVDWLRFIVNNSVQFDLLPDQAVFYEKVVAPNVDSSGSFTHCHVCEPDSQATNWASLVGRLMESTGLCAVRDAAGALVTDFTQAPSRNHAMASVRLAQTSVLGVLNSVELVVDGEIHHAHGITLSHKVAEAPGHKVLRVCGAGDTFVWVVRPVANETLLTPALLSGLYSKFENGVELDEKVVVTCHDDYSFQMTINSPNVLSRLSALEGAFEALTNSA